MAAGAVVHMRGRRPAVPQARTWARTRGDSDCRSGMGRDALEPARVQESREVFGHRSGSDGAETVEVAGCPRRRAVTGVRGRAVVRVRRTRTVSPECGDESAETSECDAMCVRESRTTVSRRRAVAGAGR